MARIFHAGWEFENAADGGVFTLFGAPTATVGAARGGSARGLEVKKTLAAGGVTMQIAPNLNVQDAKWRIYVQLKIAHSATSIFMELDDNLTGLPVCMIKFTSARKLQLFSGGVSPAQIGVDSAALDLDKWYRVTLEYDASLLTATGYLALEFEPDISFASGIAVPATVNVASFLLGNIDPVSCEFWLDDLAYNDDTGSNENGLPGEGQVFSLIPFASGDNAQWARGGTDSGFDHGQVDEAPPNDDTDYLIGDVNNDIVDLKVIGAAVGVPSVKVVQGWIRQRAQAAAEMSYKLRLKSQSGGTVQEGTLTTHNDVTWRMNGDALPRLPSLTSYTDPQGGGPWTPTLLDNAQFGVEAVDADPDVFVTAMRLMVDFARVGAVKDPILSHGIVPFSRS